MVNPNIADLRENYKKGELLLESTAASPFDQFQQWFDEALASDILEPNAMTLSTVNADGQPSSEPPRRAQLPLERTRAPSLYPWHHSKDPPRGIRNLLPLSPLPLANRCMGLRKPKRMHPQPPTPGRPRSRTHRPIPRRHHRPPPRLLGRLQHHPPSSRILARPP